LANKIKKKKLRGQSNYINTIFGKKLLVLKLFDLSLQLNGYPIRWAKQHLNSIIELPEEQFITQHEAQKKALLDFHLQHNSFYQKKVGDRKDLSWEQLPILQKSDYQVPLSERFSTGYSEKNCYLNKTSGSSGDPMVFAKDKNCHALIWANIMRKFALHGIDFNRSYQARFYGMPMAFWPQKLLRIKDFLSNRYRMNIFDLSDQGLDKMIQQFASKRFDYINGYTSAIVLLAKQLESKNRVLKTLCPSLKVCIVTSEMLFEADKILLEKALGVPIVNEYGASEVDLIAFQNPESEWVVNAETCLVEIVDEQDRVLPYGQEGRIIVTQLYNKAMPFIRYEVGDYGILDPKSTPQKPILQKLVGRTNDVIQLPSGKRAAGMAFYSITKALFDDQSPVKEFVIKQTKIDTFEIEYVSSLAFTKDEEQHVYKVISDFLEPHLQLHFVQKDQLKRGSNGKLKQFISLLN
jgi:phenylacetate-CoA ligase